MKLRPKHHFMLYASVERLAQALVMRQIRNDCRAYMTRDGSKIGLLRQIWWFYRTYQPARRRGTRKAFLYYLPDRVVGYGMITVKRQQAWLSGGLSASARGMGMGRSVFAHLARCGAEMGHAGVYLEVLKTNVRARKLYEKLGFTPVRSRGKVLVMKR